MIWLYKEGACLLSFFEISVLFTLSVAVSISRIRYS